MSEPAFAIRDYLTPSLGSFWKWSDDYEVITWTDGRTIAFRGELEAVLRRQVSRGLPSLSLIVMVLAACRDSWRELDEATISPESQGYSSEWSFSPQHDANPLFESLSSRLDRVHALPAKLRQAVGVKAELVATAFETNRQRCSVMLAGEIVAVISEGALRETIEPITSPSAVQWAAPREIRDLIEGLDRIDAESLELRFQTSLDQIVLPAEVEEPLATKVRKLFERLESDEEFAGMVRLARNLLALVSLPRPLDQNDEIPVGGISDISNRGTLDRLLLSELAQDDDTLMMRVAMNEAMYLRRETPPRNPPRGRLLVLDAGLRMWGIPRVFSTSVALSFAAMTGTAIDLRVLCSVGTKLQPADVSTRDGLVSQLKVLRPEVHPGAALADLSRWSDEAELETDVILVTCDDVLADAEFQRALEETEIGFVVTVSRDGEFRLMQRTMHGTKMVRQAQLDVDTLLEPPARKPVVPLIDPTVSIDLPAILGVQPFPLRLSHSVTHQQAWTVRQHGALAITNDRRLMHWDDPARGGKQITDRLPSRRLLWSRTHAEHGCTQFVVGNASKPGLTLGVVDLEHGFFGLLPLETGDAHVFAVCDHAGALFVIHRNEIDVCDMLSGERIQTVEVPGDRSWVNSRFFRGFESMMALSYDGVTARFEEVAFNVLADHGSLITMFDVEGVQGPVGMMRRSGMLYYTAENRHAALQNPLRKIERVHQISPDGSRVVVATAAVKSGDPPVHYVVNVKEHSVAYFYGDPQNEVDPSIRQFIHPQNYRNRFQAIGVGAGGFLLEGVGDYLYLLYYDASCDRFKLEPFDGPFDEPFYRTPTLHEFKPVAGPPGVKYKLSVATWSDGSQAFLDSRGLLHLKSSDRRIPEATFVLAEDDVAGWCTLGSVWGPDYYLGANARIERERVQKLIIDRFIIRLP